MLIRYQDKSVHPIEDRELYDRVLEILGVKNEFQKPVWPLPNLKPTTEANYWHYMTSEACRAEVWTGQMRVADVDPHPRSGGHHSHWANLMIYVVDHGRLAGGGFVVMYTYNWMNYHTGGNEDDRFPAVQYFEFRLCDHKFQEVGPVERRSRGWHVYKCEKCGASHTVDSGD